MPERCSINLAWRTAASCHANGSCVEVAPDAGGVAVRDSTAPGGAVLRFGPAQWERFVRTTQRGGDRG